MALSVGTLEATIEANARPFNQAMRKVRSEGEKTSDAIDRTFRSLGRRIGQAVAVAVPAISIASVKAFAEQEKAELRLRAALESNERAVDSLFNRYREFASQMQRVTTVGDETTIVMLAQAEAFGLTGDVAERAVRNAISLGAAFDVSERSALRYTAALEAGNATMLARYLPTLRKLEPGTERVAEAQRLLARGFSAAEAEAGSLGGTFDQMKNNVGDTLENFGELISESSTLNDSMRELSEGFAEANREGSELNDIAIGVTTSFRTASWAIRGFNESMGDTATIIRDIQTFGLTALARDFGQKFVESFREIGASVRFADQVREGFLRMIEGSEGLTDIDDRLNNIINRTRDLANENEGLSFTTEEVLANYNEFKNSLDRVEESASNVIDITEQLGRQISDQASQIEITANLPEPGSIADIEQQMAFLRDRMQEASSAAEFAPLNDELETLRQRLAAIRGEAQVVPGSIEDIAIEMDALDEKMRQATNPEQFQILADQMDVLRARMAQITGEVLPEFQRFGNEVANIFDQLIFQGRTFNDIMEDLLRKLASRVIANFAAKALTAAAGSAGSSGGLFGSVGVGSVAPQAASSSANITLNVKGELVGQGSTLKAIIDQTSTDLERLT